MRVTLSWRNGRLIGLALLWVVAASAQARRMPIGPEGPDWMRPAAVTRQAESAPTPDRNITQSSGDDRDPVWSADGTLIAFASNRAGSFDIYTSRPDGSHPDSGAANTPKLISGLPGDERYPAFSPGGTELAYVRGSAIYIRNLRTGIESTVSDQVGQPTGLVFSFDGQRLAFSSRIGTDLAPNIYWISLNPNNRTLTQVTDTAANDVAPAWFPRSSTLAFASDRGGDYDIYRVEVNGPGTPAVPEIQHQLVVGGPGNQTEPAWVNRGGIGAAGYDQAFHLLYADDEGGAHYDVKLADGDGDPRGDIVYSDKTATAPAHQTEPFANPVQTSSSSLCVYAGNQTGNWELYTTSIFDNSPPVLSDGTQVVLPKVTPQQTFPGASVRIEAHVFDVGSGVSDVFALIRRAEHSVYQRNNQITGNGTDVGVIGSSGDNRVAMGLNNIEYEQVIIDAQTYGDINPATVQNTPEAWRLLLEASGLRLYDNGTHGDREAGDGIWTAEWATPSDGQDFYVDIVPYDGRGNVPYDNNLALSSRPGGGSNPLYTIQSGFPGNPFYAVGYDRVAGFTTRSLDLTRKILFVSDYAAGQKFQVADFAGNDQTSLTRFWPAALPVEHYYFATDDQTSNAGIDPAQHPDTPGFRLVGTSPPTVHMVSNSYGGQWGFPAAGQQTGDNAFYQAGAFPFGGSQVEDKVAIWRILSRGPVDAPTLNAYTPLPLPQPAGSVLPAQDGDRMLVWVSPYTGNLLVQPGTLLDADVQQSLASFVQAGGRMFINGQDIAWALTKNGTQANTFLTNTLRATFVSDAAPDVKDVTVRGGVQRRELNDGVGLQGVEQQLFRVNAEMNPITGELTETVARWQRQGGAVGFTGGPRSRAGSQGWVIRGNGGWYGGSNNFSGDGASNGWFIDDIAPAAGGIAALTYRSGGQTAMVRHIDAATGGRVVYAAFPFESVRNEFQLHNGWTTNTNWILGTDDRVVVMTNISNYLRSGGLMGKVVGPDGATPVGGVTVEARVGPNRDGQVMATTTTLADGTYLFRGLSTAGHSVYVVSDEYTADHRPFEQVEGGQILQSADLTIRLLRFDTGTIVGTVTQDGGATVGGARVTVTLQTTGSNPLTQTVQTDNNGQYSLDVPAGTYTVTAEATGYGAASQTDVVVTAGAVVQVDLMLQAAPGTLDGTVAAANQPVGGAMVSIQSGGTTVAAATTDGNGHFTVDLAAGEYTVLVTASGYQQATQAGVAVISDDTTTVTFTLASVPPGALTGLISLQGSTAPVAGVTVNLVTGGAIVRATSSAETATTVEGNTYNYRFDDVPAGQYEVRIVATGYGSDSRTGLTVEAEATTTGVDFQLQPLHSFVAGLSMTSAPYDYAGVAPDIQTILDDDDNPATRLRLAAWDTQAGDYRYYPNSPAKTFHLGRGYFMLLDQNVPLTTQGVRAPEVGLGQDIQLLAGWNLIGHVYEFPVDLFECRVLYGNQNLSMQQAAAQGLVNAALFTLNFGQYQQIYRFDPYTGYWLRAFQNVTLRVPPTSLRAGREAGVTPRAVAAPDNWLAGLVATGQDGRSARASFGVASDAAGVYDTHDRAQPPRPPLGGYLEISFPHPDWGRYSDRYQTDVRSRQAAERWDLVVDTDQTRGDVTLSWPSLGAEVPANLDVILVDQASGRRQSMRHRTTWSWPAEGGPRAFSIEVSRQAERPAITQLGFTTGRGGGGLIHYTLTGPLTVSVEILGGSGGRAVRTLVRGASRAAGAGSEGWDGRDDQGRPVPNGTYTIQLVGVDEVGRQVRMLRTVAYQR